MASIPFRQLRVLKSLYRNYQQPSHQWSRDLRTTSRHYGAIRPEDKDEQAKELAINKPREIFEKEFPDHFRDGKFISRMSYVEFIDEALAKMKELGLERDLNAYKELLKVFPPGKYWPKKWDSDYGLFHAPQQLAAVRVLHQMQMSGLKPDKDFEKIIIDAFSKKSDVWIKVIRMNFWSMKGRNIDPNPLPEVLPKEPHQLAKLALARMFDDPKTIITVTNTSRVPNSVDKTWLVFSQSPAQKEIIEGLAETSTLYVEEGGTAYVGRDYLSYFVLKYYVDDETREKKLRPPAPDSNYNTLKVKFYGKPVKEKYADALDKHFVDGSYVLGICATGTSSQDSLLSWLKILQERNPKLSKLNVVFKMSRRSPEIIEYEEKMRKTGCDSDDDKRYQQEQHSSH
uniref:Evolutionarily conserved signaling intermediate in Toll pathway, mitochondrial n=2 Tax=Aceria tosichella TaxID=561515 RepID=A0A6G1SDJ5_9ACAR